MNTVLLIISRMKNEILPDLFMIIHFADFRSGIVSGVDNKSQGNNT
jgi:hypothetical protein